MTFSVYSNVVIDYTFPQGVAGAYSPNVADALLANSGVVITPLNSPTIDANGGVYSNANFTAFLECSGVPTKATTIRKYEVWGEVPGSSGVNDGGVSLYLNYQDSNNWFRVLMVYNTGSAQHYAQIARRVAGVETYPVGFFFGAGVAQPNRWKMTAYDQGDTIWFAIEIWETDDFSTSYTSTVYSVGSRPLQTVTGLRIYSWTTPSFSRVRGFRVSDV